MFASLPEKHRYAILAALLLLTPLAALGAAKAMRTGANDVRTWLPEGLPETDDYAFFTRHFGGEEFVAVSWEGCTLDDARLARLEANLKKLAARRNEPSLIESVITGPAAIAQLRDPPAKLSHEEAIARLSGVMVGPDGRQTCALVRPTEAGKQAPRRLLDLIRRQAIQCGAPADSLRMGGPPATSSAIDEAAALSLAAPGPIAVLAAVLFCWFCFRSWRLTFFVVFIGAFSATAAAAVVWYTGGQMNAVLLSMPPLVYVAATSGAIHWANYYREEVEKGGARGAPARATAQARLPLVLATATTSMGLLSLAASELSPIRHFGVYAAIGVAASLVWLLGALPAMTAAWPLRKAAGNAHAHPQSLSRWSTAGDFVASRHALISIVCLGAALACAFGLSKIHTSVSAEEFFPDDAELPKTSRWLEEKLGGMVPMEIVIRFRPECPLTPLERMELVQTAERRAAEVENVAASVSAATFSPAMPESSGRYTVRRSVYNRKLEQNRDRLIDSGYLAATAEGEELWRISLRTRSFHGVDQRYFIDRVRERVLPVIHEECAASGDHISATFTGMVPLINRAQQSLLEGLCLGLVTDLALVVITIVVLMRHWSAGLVMLATCLTPTLVVLGAMGWLGIPLDIGAVLAPSVALGVSVDDVLHFVLCFRRGLEQGLDRRQSVALAWRHCARAMFQSWGVIGLGLGVFGLSDFAPTQRFGLLMLLLVSVGLFVNLVLLPALLIGPLGALLARRFRFEAGSASPQPIADGAVQVVAGSL